MAEETYKPNSNRYKEQQKENVELPQKKVEKVVTGKVITKKKNNFQKLGDKFISEDAGNVVSYIFGDVLVPAIKKAISDIVTDGIDIILYGESRNRTRRSPSGTVSYRNYYDRDYRTPRRDMNERQAIMAGSGLYSYDDIILESRGEAENVLNRMDEIMDVYGLVRVADLFDLVGISGNPTDNSYGWTNIRNAEVVRVRDGYKIKMPRAMPID